MDESPFRPHKKWQAPPARRQTQNECQYFLRAEEKILQAIYAHAPVAGILNEICIALDCEIGNTVSVISTFAEDAASAAALARTAKIFGLHLLSSAKIMDEHCGELGSLEVYCCDPRTPFTEESRWVERALHLAAIAIDRDIKVTQRASLRLSDNRPVPRRVLEWPI